MRKIKRTASYGPGKFVTKFLHTLEDDVVRIETSRRERKGMGPVFRKADGSALGPRTNPWIRFWAPDKLAWWTAILFLCGSTLFCYGPSLFLFPRTAWWIFTQQNCNNIYLVGSFFFTAASYLQYFQMLNAEKGPAYFSGNGALPRKKFVFFGWEPKHLAFWSCFSQFLGALFFNVDCFSAFVFSQNVLMINLSQWLPSVIGSILFVISAYLLFMEVGHGYFHIKARSISWWVAAVNLTGCLGFLVGSLLGICLPGTQPPLLGEAANAFNLQGAMGFWGSSYLMLPEMFSESV